MGAAPGHVPTASARYSVGIFRTAGHTGGMGRMVTAVVTYGSMCVGVVGPFHVGIPWWAEVEPVVAHLEETLGVPVVVLRLLTVEGSDGARDGHVTYHVQALQSPGDLAACDFVDGDHPLRLPWARASGVQELFGWASRYVDLIGRPKTAPSNAAPTGPLRERAQFGMSATPATNSP